MLYVCEYVVHFDDASHQEKICFSLIMEPKTVDLCIRTKDGQTRTNFMLTFIKVI